MNLNACSKAVVENSFSIAITVVLPAPVAATSSAMKPVRRIREATRSAFTAGWGMVKAWSTRSGGELWSRWLGRSYVYAVAAGEREVVAGLDIMIVRELTGGVYFGEPKTITDLGNGQKRAVDTQVYDTYEIERIGRVAFELARKRNNKVTSSEKRNVMKSGNAGRIKDAGKRKLFGFITVRG